jgi:hypothetical protein
MVLVGPAQQTTFEMACSQPIFKWEGRSSTARFTSSAEGVSVEFKLDIIGPDWLYISLSEGEEGLALSVRRTNNDSTAGEPVDHRSYANYGALQADAEYGPFVSALLRRCGQNPLLPDLDCLRTTLFGVDPPSEPRIEARCEDLIRKLDAPSWKTRTEAARQLSEPGMVQHALAVARHMDLSPEQRARISRIAERYSVDLTTPLVAPLVALEFPDGDLALVSE